MGSFKQTQPTRRLVMEFIHFLQETLITQLPEIIAAYDGDVTASSLSEMETAIKEMSHIVGGELLAQWLAAQTPKYPEDEVRCAHCGGQARDVRWRGGMRSEERRGGEEG